jgi:hypothetical protein
VFAGADGGRVGELCCGDETFDGGSGVDVFGSGVGDVDACGSTVMDTGVTTGEGAGGTSLSPAPPTISPHATAGTATTAVANTAKRPVTIESLAAV